MYSPSVIQRNVEQIETATGLLFTRHPVAESREQSKSVLKAFNKEGKPVRKLLDRERKFILNEQTLCGLDYRYWAERYGTIFLDGGGVGQPQFWESQEIVLRILSKAEEQMDDLISRNQPVEGLRVLWHKARQLGATAFGRLLIMHRLSLTKDNRAIAASVDDKKKLELYERDKLIYDNLPFYLKPATGYDTKAEHWTLTDTNSSVLYTDSREKSGMGVGRQFNMPHFTELSTWEDADIKVELDFFPAVPQNRHVLWIQESTAYGRNNWWHTFSESVRSGDRPNWLYVFIPWYVEESKYRRQPLTKWRPSELTKQHADKVWETSYEWCGRRVRLTREKMYWYESERAAYQKDGRLNYFLTNWCATPEESFQHSGASAFPPEFLEKARLGARPGVAYGFEVRA
jgi:hypothetical protein